MLNINTNLSVPTPSAPPARKVIAFEMSYFQNNENFGDNVNLISCEIISQI